MTRSAGHFVGGERGVVLIEFALVAPVLLLTLVACLDIARAVNALVTVSNASREGARFAVVHQDADPGAIQQAVLERVSPLDASAVTVTTTYDDGAGPVAWPAGGLPQSVRLPQPILVRVDVSYPWQAVTWLVGAYFASTGSRTFTGSSAMEAIH